MGSAFSRRRLILSALLGITIIVVAYGSTLPATTKQARATNSDDLLKTLASKDSDGDGLLDWEETLYGTDPQNPYSVKEGVFDGDAVSQGLAVISRPTTATQTVSEEDIPVPDAAAGSFTEHFADFLFTEYSSVISGPGATDAQKQEVIAGVVEAFTENTEKFFVSRHTFNSLQVVPAQDMDYYIYSIESLFTQKGTGLGDTDPLDLVNEAIDNDSPTAKEQLIVFARFYATLASDLAELQVPSIVADHHLSLVQAFDRFAIALAAIGHIDSDPLVSLAVLPLFESEPEKAGGALQKILETFSRQAGTPQPGQTGHVLRTLSLPPESL